MHNSNEEEASKIVEQLHAGEERDDNDNDEPVNVEKDDGPEVASSSAGEADNVVGDGDDNVAGDGDAAVATVQSDKGDDGSPADTVIGDDDPLDLTEFGDRLVRVNGLENPIKIADLIARAVETRDDRDTYLAKMKELSARERETVERLTRAETEFAQRYKKFDAYDVPHVFLGQTLQEYVQNGLLPQEAYNAIDQVFTDLIEGGKYNPHAAVQRYQQRALERKEAQERAQQAREDGERRAHADLREIARLEGTPMTDAHKKLLWQKIEGYAKETGTWLTVFDAYKILKQSGEFRTRPALATPRKQTQQRRATLREALVPKAGSSKTVGRSKLDEAAEIVKMLNG